MLKEISKKSVVDVIDGEEKMVSKLLGNGADDKPGDVKIM